MNREPAIMGCAVFGTAFLILAGALADHGWPWSAIAFATLALSCGAGIVWSVKA